MSISVRPVTTSHELATWVSFPRLRVYPPASPWVPPLDRDLARLLDRRQNPFFQQGDATAYLAYSASGQPVGRILAQVYHPHNQRHDERTGFFGFFECLDDREAATALIQAAARAGAAWGCETLRGPFNMTAMQEMGILVDGFQYPPAVDQTYTQPYYPALLERAGLRAIYPHTTYRIDDVRDIDLDGLLGERHRILTAERRLRVRSARMREFDRELETLRVLLNDSFAELSHFVPLTAAELAFQVGAYRSYLDPALLLVAEMDGVPRGFVLAVPDFNPLLKRLNGQADASHLLNAAPTIGNWLWRRDACLVIQGVERRLQGQGVMRVLHAQLIRNLRWRRYRGLSVTWIEEENRRSAGSVLALGAHPRHRLALYEGPISALT
jgi:hypothetical protein